MKTQMLNPILISTLALTLTSCATASNPAAYDYKAEVPAPGMVSRDINDNQRQGWKLVSMSPFVDKNGNASIILLLKRQHE